MKTKLFLAAMSALFLASCASEDVGGSAPQNEAIGFDTYTPRASRGGSQEVDNAYLQANGFGVFAFDQGTQSLASYTTTNATPNFFHNQQVKFTTPNWTYSPLKYWPNNVDNKVSFYAYAPYQQDLSTNATPNAAGLRLILATNSNGPAIQYTVPSGLSAGIDLCWGADGNSTTTPVTSPVDIIKNRPANSQFNTIPSDGKIKFNFKHALSKISFNIQAHYDEATNGHNPGTNPIDANTTITVRSIKLIGAFASKGILSLYDGKWNAEKGVSQEVELLTSAIVMNSTDDYKTEHELFDGNAIMLIPGGSFQIQVTYDVETVDATNTANSSKVTNKITSAQNFTLVGGEATAYHLNLGLTSVKFNAEVEPWTNKDATEVLL